MFTVFVAFMGVGAERLWRLQVSVTLMGCCRLAFVTFTTCIVFIAELHARTKCARAEPYC